MSHPFDTRPPSAQLVEFCEDLFPLVKRAMRDSVALESLSHKQKGGRSVTLEAAKVGFPRDNISRVKLERDVTGEAWKKAFFYPSGIYVGRDNLVSDGALRFFKSRSVPEAGWRMLREPEQKHIDPGHRQGSPELMSSSGAQLIHEHVWTGTMAWEGCMALYRHGTIAELIHSNYCTAWVLRAEDKKLEKSHRGNCLADAFAHYRSLGISLYREGPAPGSPILVN